MKPTFKPQQREQTVPLQRSSAAWLDEPGYGGTPSAWEQFDLEMDQQLAVLRAKHPDPRPPVDSNRPR